MKITAGLGSVEEYERFVRAGADEFFSGYVPYEWAKKYGTVMPTTEERCWLIMYRLVHSVKWRSFLLW